MTELYTALPADDLSRAATILHADDLGLTHLGIGAGTYTILISGDQTGGAYTLIDMLVPAGGPPPHRHDFEEMFYMLEGELDVTFRNEDHRIGPGQAINIPANAPHVFRVASATPARFLCLCLPAGQDEFFKLAGEVLPTRTSTPAVPSAERVDEIRGLMLPTLCASKASFCRPRLNRLVYSSRQRWSLAANSRSHLTTRRARTHYDLPWKVCFWDFLKARPTAKIGAQ